MAMLNIDPARRKEAFYRYKMPELITKIEGRGNGIKTNVVNMVDVAKALSRPASYTIKYFGSELGAQSKFNEKTGLSVVNGAHDTIKLGKLRDNFIKKYVLCYGCDNPETEIIIKKTQMITLRCAACGFVSDVDMRDKLSSFILKNPPEQKNVSKDKKAMRQAEKERIAQGEAADEEQKNKGSLSLKEATKSTKGKQAMGSDQDHDQSDDVQWQTDTSLEAARKRCQEQLSAATAQMVMLSTDPKADKDEKKQPKQEEPSAHESLVNEIKDCLDKGFTTREIVSFLDSLAETRQEVMSSFFEALFEGVCKGFAEEVDKKEIYISSAVRDEGSQILLLRAMEAFCEKTGGDAVKEAVKVVKSFYDKDILDEESIVQWYGEGLAGANKSSKIWKYIKPLVEWLQSAESESEDE